MCEPQSIYNINYYTKQFKKCKKEHLSLWDCVDHYNGIRFCSKKYLELMKCIENSKQKDIK